MINKNNKKGFVFVNLMPFREQIKKEQLKQFYIILGLFAAIATFLVFITYSFVNMQLDSQLARNTYIEKENKKLDEEIKEIANLQSEINDTLGKRKVVEGLQVNRVDAVNILNEVSTQLPEGMKLSEISSKINGKKDIVTLKGTTNSNNKVSVYMTNLVNSGIFKDPVLIEIKANSGNNKKNEQQNAIENNFHIELTMQQVIDVEPEVKKPANIKK